MVSSTLARKCEMKRVAAAVLWQILQVRAIDGQRKQLNLADDQPADAVTRDGPNRSASSA
jgi:hypothetical protein